MRHATCDIRPEGWGQLWVPWTSASRVVRRASLAVSRQAPAARRPAAGVCARRAYCRLEAHEALEAPGGERAHAAVSHRSPIAQRAERRCRRDCRMQDARTSGRQDARTSGRQSPQATGRRTARECRHAGCRLRLQASKAPLLRAAGAPGGGGRAGRDGELPPPACPARACLVCRGRIDSPRITGHGCAGTVCLSHPACSPVACRLHRLSHARTPCALRPCPQSLISCAFCSL